MMSMDARFVAMACVLLASAFASVPARAVPSFARALGNAPCSTCHTDFPQLNAFGRLFKLSGYTLGGSPAPSSSKEPAPSPESSVSLDALPPLSVMVEAAYTNIGATLPDNQNNNGQLPQQASLFVAGRIAPGLGSFMQITYSQADGEIAMDNAELRYSRQKTVKGKPVTFGAVLNNNPTVEDLWNSTPAWGFPWAGPDVTPGPIASTLIDGGLAQDVIGIGGFVSVSGKLYAASTLYRSAHIGSVSPGIDSQNTIDNVATYWRVAWQFVKGAHSLEVGGYGLHARLVPEGIDGQTDSYDDRAVDFQYERTIHSRNLVIHGTYIDENSDLAASSGLGMVGVPNAHLNTLRFDAGLHGPKMGYVVGYQRSHGSTDTLRFGPESATGSAVGRPDTNSLIAEAIYSPWQNVQLRVQYTAYGKFNGASSNYDGFGRNASDNNTLLLHAWFVW